MEEEIKDQTPEPSELDELKKKSDEYLNNWKRAAADFINYKKDEVERAGLLVNYAKQDMIFKVLPILDSIYLLQKHTKTEGVDMIQKQIDEFLKKEGIEGIETLGKPFNPETMEAVEEVDLTAGEAGGGDSQTVAEELQKGYTLDGKVLRPAKVKINK